MKEFYEINNVDKQKLNEKLNKTLVKEKSFKQKSIEYDQRKKRAKNIKLRIETDDEFKFFSRLNKIGYYRDVRELISAKYDERKSETDKNKAISCNINYLKNKAAKVDTKATNFYEKKLFSFFNPGCSSENSVDESILLFLLDQEIDLKIQNSNYFGIPIVLESFLCMEQNNKNVIRKLLERDLRLYYSDAYTNFSDLFQLSIKGEDLKRAEETLNKEKYNFVCLEAVENLKKNGSVKFDYMDRCNCDGLSKALKILFKNGNTKEEKVEFLNKVLYNDKVKVFDVSNFDIISKIYSDKEYMGFLNYMKGQFEEGNIIAFNRTQNAINTDDIFTRVYSDDAYNKGISYRKVNG